MMGSRAWRCGRVLPVLLALGVVLAACGGGDTSFSNEVVPQQVAVAVESGGALRWDKASYEATAGAVTFVVTNPSTAPHQFTVAGNGVSYRSPTIKAGASGTYTVKALPPGEYQVICDYPGHKAAGMVAKLIVR